MVTARGIHDTLVPLSKFLMLRYIIYSDVDRWRGSVALMVMYLSADPELVRSNPSSAT